jgi:hypothetical protein
MGREQRHEVALARKIENFPVSAPASASEKKSLEQEEPCSASLRRQSPAWSRVMPAKQLNELVRDNPLFSRLKHE